jgi:hypothetical protein
MKKKDTYDSDSKSSSLARKPDDILDVGTAEASGAAASGRLRSASSSLCPLGLDSAVSISSLATTLQRLAIKGVPSSSSSSEASRCSTTSAFSSTSSERASS